MERFVINSEGFDDVDIWESLRDYALKKEHPLDIKRSEVMSVTGMTAQDFIDNFDIIYNGLKIIENEKKG